MSVEELRAEIMQLHKAGCSIEEIWERTGASVEHIRRQVSSERRAARKAAKAERIAEEVRLYRGGMSYHMIAKQLGRDPRDVAMDVQRALFPDAKKTPVGDTPIEIGGITKSLYDWGDEYGIGPTTMLHRYRSGKRGADLIAPLTPNKRGPRMVTIGGETKTLKDWERCSGISRHTILDRIKRGVTEEHLLDSPGRYGDMPFYGCNHRKTDADCDTCPYPDCCATVRQCMDWSVQNPRDEHERRERDG